MEVKSKHMSAHAHTHTCAHTHTHIMFKQLKAKEMQSLKKFDTKDTLYMKE